MVSENYEIAPKEIPILSGSTRQANQNTLGLSVPITQQQKNACFHLVVFSQQVSVYTRNPSFLKVRFS